MKILQNIRQGDAAWHTARAQHLCASEAAAALGVSKHTSRAELLRVKATGITPEVTPDQQRLFDRGHAAETAARQWAEAITGEELAPVVATLDVDGLPLLASFDGIDFMGEVIWENKLLNQSLIAQIDAGELEPHYHLQIEHQLLVSGASRCLFTASDGTEAGTHHLWYESRPERRAALIAGWKQFQVDLAAYVPTEPVAPVVAAPMESLPAVVVQVQGALTVAGNLPAFGEALRGFIERIPTKPATDQEFADAEAACKALKKAEDALTQAEDSALAQISDVEVMRRTVSDLKNLARTTRLATEKLVTAEKEARKLALVQEAQAAMIEHILGLNRELASHGAGSLPPPAPGSFAPCIKGLKSLESMTDKLRAELMTRKAEADTTARRLRENRQTLRREDGDWIFLFADFTQVGTKAAEDFAALAHLRISQHQQAEAARIEVERQRIEAEAKARAEREAAAKLEEDRRRIEAEQRAAAEAERARIRAEEQAKAQAEAQAARESLERQAKQQAQELVHIARELDAEKHQTEHAKTGERLTLGQINAMLAPISINAAGLAELGFNPVATEKAAKLYAEADFPIICAAIVRHVAEVAA